MHDLDKNPEYPKRIFLRKSPKSLFLFEAGMHGKSDAELKETAFRVEMFAKTFNMHVTAEDNTEVGSKEDYLPAGKILNEHGCSWKDFKEPEEALARVRHLCAMNSKEHGYEPKAEVIDDVYPEFSKFFFCFSLAGC